MYGLEQIPGDKIIRSNISFEDSTPYNADGTCKDDFVYKYTDPNYVFDLIGDFDELVVGGNHATDCVKRMAEAALSRGISSLVDLDLTDFFFMLYWKRDYFDIAEYSPSRYKEFALLKRGEKNYELTKRIFERNFTSPVYGFEEEKLTFYITSCSFCLCNSACSLQSLDHIGHIVSESGDLQY